METGVNTPAKTMKCNRMIYLVMTESTDSLWMLHCKNDKCNEFFDYFGRSLSSKSVNCTNCGQPSLYGIADFVRHDSVE